MESEQLREFLRGIVQEKAQVELDKDIEDQLIADLYDRLENQIYRSLVSELSSSQLEELEKQDSTPEQILLFIENSGIIVQDNIAKVLVQFRESYIKG